MSKFVAKSQHLTGTPPVAYSLEHPVQTTGFRNLELRVSLLPQTAVCCRLFSADLRIDFAIKHLHHLSPKELCPPVAAAVQLFAVAVCAPTDVVREKVAVIHEA